MNIIRMWVEIMLVLAFTLLLGSRPCLGEHFAGYVSDAVSTDAYETAPIEGEYIVALDNTKHEITQQEIKDLEAMLDLQIESLSVIGSKTFLTVKGKQGNLAKLRERSDFLYVEQNHMMEIYRAPTLPPLDPLKNPENGDDQQNKVYTDMLRCKHDIISSELWGLDRIDQQENVFESQEREYVYEYVYELEGNGRDVTVYVVDSGIYVSHSQFDGRARWGFTTTKMDGDEDLNGHGTHVAGIIGSRDYGVAKNVNLIAVKVLNASGHGPVDVLLEAIEWIGKEFLKEGKRKTIINFSLEINGTSRSLNDAIRQLIRDGMTVVVAAGNHATNSCDISPAMVREAITVGAIGPFDQMTGYSNWGPCVDIFAPGEHILSTDIGANSDNKLNPTKSGRGTSQAAPHVTGAIARYMSSLDYNPSPEQVFNWLKNTSTKNKIGFENSDQKTSPNSILYVPCLSESNCVNISIHVYLLAYGLVELIFVDSTY